MPGFDGTGPRGQGPRTGGGFGYCAPGSGPGYGAGGFPRGAGRGGFPWGGGRGRAWGGGRGWGGQSMYGGYPPPAAQWTPEQELESLQMQAQAMEQELQSIRQRITELGDEGKKK